MKAYLLTWNPKYWSWNDIGPEISWRCANKQPKPEDMFFISAVGESQRKGIFCSGVVETLQKDMEDDIDPSKTVDYLVGKVTAKLNPENQDILDIDTLKKEFSGQEWSPRQSGIEIKANYADALSNLWETFLKQKHKTIKPVKTEIQDTWGIVYVVKNPSFKEDIIKIGRTRNLPQRLKDLSGTNVPYPYECLYACEVKDSKEVEDALHDICRSSNVSKEFFSIDPEPVISLLKQLAIKEVTNDVEQAIATKVKTENVKDEKKAITVSTQKDIPDGYKVFEELKQFLSIQAGFRLGYFATRVLASHKLKKVKYYLHKDKIYYNEQVFLEQAKAEGIFDKN